MGSRLFAADLTDTEREALAILRSGGSFKDASDRSRLTVEQVMALWAKHGKA